jgi:hypothetical protein
VDVEDEGIGVCRNLAGSLWLLMHKRRGKWRMLAPPFGPLSQVIADALKLLEPGMSFSLSDRRLGGPFLEQPFPETVAELGRLHNVALTIMAPEQAASDEWGAEDRARMARGFPPRGAGPASDPVWGCVTLHGGVFTRSAHRFKTPALIEEIGNWVRDPHGGGGYQSFAKVGLLPHYRELACRPSWSLRDIAPALFEVAA